MYYVQTRAPAGNWTDYLGTSDKDSCVQHGAYLIKTNQYRSDDVRVVERIDIVVWGS